MQILPYQSTKFRHGAYMVQFLQDSQSSPFRAAVQHVDTGEERQFDDLVSLLQFLQRQTRKSFSKLA